MLRIIENTSNKLLIRANTNSQVLRNGWFILEITQENRVVKTACVKDGSIYPEYYNIFQLTEGTPEDGLNGVVDLERGTHRVKIYHSSMQTLDTTGAEYLFEDYLYIR